jgi:uncharacterized protein (TIGR02996 family)
MPKAPNVVDLLERAAQALDASKPAEALDPLRAAWQLVRSRELGDLLDRVSASAGRGDAFPGKTARLRHEAWLALAAQRSPRDVERLLSVLLEGVKSPEATERLDALAAFAPDGRIAKALTAIAARPPFQAQTTKPFWKKLFPLLVTHADPRTVDVLGPLADGYVARVGAAAMGTYMKNQLDAALGKIRTELAAPPPLTEAAENALRRLAAHVPAPAPHAAGVAEKAEKDFLAAIAAAPDDDAPRLVYADWLQERGDARGEFITLQFQRRRDGGLSAKEQARETALLTKHKRDWLGPFYRPLQTLWSDVRFERGFLALVPFCAHPTGVEECAGDVRWTTVEELFLPPRPFSFAALFEAPVFGGLRLLRGAASDVVTTLLRTGVAPRLASLRCAGFDRGDGAALAKLSELTSLAIDPPAGAPRTRAEDAAWMLELAVMDRLARFHVTVEPDNATFAELFAASDARPDLGLEIRSQSHHHYATLTFARSAEGRRSKLLLDIAKGPHQAPLVAHYAPLLKNIPADTIGSVHVTGAEQATQTAVARLLARFEKAAVSFG